MFCTQIYTGTSFNFICRWNSLRGSAPGYLSILIIQALQTKQAILVSQSVNKRCCRDEWWQLKLTTACCFPLQVKAMDLSWLNQSTVLKNSFCIVLLLASSSVSMFVLAFTVFVALCLCFAEIENLFIKCIQFKSYRLPIIAECIS